MKITALINIHLITEELRRDQSFEMGQDIFWPRKLVGRPVQIATTNQTKAKDSNQEPQTLQVEAEMKNEDHVFNYGLQVMQMGMFFIQIDDTKRKGDRERMMRNWKMIVLYVRCSGRSKKYTFEAMCLLMYCRALFTAKMACRVIYGQFVNPSGGIGKNYANDLKQEHLVKCNKVILRGLCGNKTLKAVTRATQSLYNVKKITSNLDIKSNITPDSQSHTYGDLSADIKLMVSVLRKLKPFSNSNRRKHTTFPSISNSLLNHVDIASLAAWLSSKKQAIGKNPFLVYRPGEEEENVETEDLDDEEEDM